MTGRGDMPIEPGPPWLGPVVPRRTYNRHWLAVCAVMGASAVFFFGWRAAGVAALTALATTATFAAGIIPVRMFQGRDVRASVRHVVILGLLAGLTLTMVTSAWPAVLMGALVGALSHVVGFNHRVRVHPVALAHVLMLVVGPIAGGRTAQTILSPQHVVIGDVQNVGPWTGGSSWASRRVPQPHDAFAVPMPDQFMHQQQRRILRQGSVLAAEMKRGAIAPLSDVLIGAVNGPIGATGRYLLICCGLWLMYRRIGRWPVALVGLFSAAAALCLMPLYTRGGGGWSLSAQHFADMGFDTAVTYIAYQLLASPLLLVLLIFAPETMPRTARGRIIYGMIIGAGVVFVRWFTIPADDTDQVAPLALTISYVPLILAGLLCPVLDRLHASPFSVRAKPA